MPMPEQADLELRFPLDAQMAEAGLILLNKEEGQTNGGRASRY